MESCLPSCFVYLFDYNQLSMDNPILDYDGGKFFQRYERLVPLYGAQFVLP